MYDIYTKHSNCYSMPTQLLDPNGSHSRNPFQESIGQVYYDFLQIRKPNSQFTLVILSELILLLFSTCIHNIRPCNITYPQKIYMA